jgi:hypothetical protein
VVPGCGQPQILRRVDRERIQLMSEAYPMGRGGMNAMMWINGSLHAVYLLVALILLLRP